MVLSNNDFESERSRRSLVCVLELLGDKWTFLIIHELFSGKHRYGDIQSSIGVPTNILASRLKSLVDYRVIEKIPYQTRPVRYEYVLTLKGRTLKPMLKALIRWGGDQ